MEGDRGARADRQVDIEIIALSATELRQLRDIPAKLAEISQA